MKKRILALMIVLCLVVGIVPVTPATEMKHSIIIPSQYEEVGSFEEGYASVKLNGVTRYGKRS